MRWDRAKDNPSQPWSKIVPSNVVRGYIKKNIRIVYEKDGDKLIIYEFCDKNRYKKVLPSLKKGTYVKTPLLALEAFYSEAA